MFAAIRTCGLIPISRSATSLLMRPQSILETCQARVDVSRLHQHADLKSNMDDNNRSGIQLPAGQDVRHGAART